jgi:DNA-binding NarL/FixJ family response regulator
VVVAEGKVRNRIRVAVVDDDEDLRLLIKDLLQRTHDFSCIGCFSNAEDALAGLPTLGPDLVLMDIRMPGVNGIECAARLKRAMPQVRIIMMTGMHGAGAIAKSRAAGAVDYLAKPVTPEQILSTLRFVAEGRPKDCPRLSQRENEVMRWLAAGLLYKEIADKMGISYAVVHKLLHGIFEKLHVSNKTEAISKWRAEAGR